MNNSVFEKTRENVRKHRKIRPATTETRRTYLVSKPNYYTTKIFPEDLTVIKMRKNQILMNKPVYLGWSILDLSKTVMYEFWYNYVKPKCVENAKLCYMDTHSFTVHVKTDVIYNCIAKHVETRFYIWNFELDRPLPKRKNKKVIGLVKDELDGKTMKNLVAISNTKIRKTKKQKSQKVYH